MLLCVLGHLATESEDQMGKHLLVSLIPENAAIEEAVRLRGDQHENKG